MSFSHAPLKNRRQFLKSAGLALSGLLLTACSPKKRAVGEGSSTATPFMPGESLSATPSPAPADAATALPSATVKPTAVPSDTPLAFTPTPLPKPDVAIGKVDSYDPVLLRKSLESLLDALGGLGDVVKPGARVGIKVNLTGGATSQKPGARPATEVYVTHPAVVGALSELLRDAGASKIYVMEAVYEPESWTVWGYDQIAQQYGIELVDLNDPVPYDGFVSAPVGEKRLVYDTLSLHPLLQELDAFVSVPKLKVHYTAGVTLSMKNLVGIAPLSAYRKLDTDTSRTLIHGGFQDGIDRHLIRSILDLNMARPIQLGIVDGIMTCEGGEGPWQKLRALQPNVLLAGKQPLALDAVSTAVMGFDPQAGEKESPFVRSENYLAMAHDLGLGTNRLPEIPVVGAAIEEVKRPFRHG